MKVLRKLFSALGVALLSLIPARTKRLIFLSSIYARMEKRPSVDRDTLHKLNKALALCNDEAALMMPVHLNRVIWNSESAEEIPLDMLFTEELDRSKLRMACTLIIKHMPAWLRYSDENVMREDLQKLFAERSVLRMA